MGWLEDLGKDSVGLGWLDGDPTGTVGKWGWQQAGGSGSSPMDSLTGDAASRRALEAQAEATRQANETQRYMYDTTRADQQPWREAGVKALGGLEDGLYGELTPVYGEPTAEEVNLFGTTIPAGTRFITGYRRSGDGDFMRDFSMSDYQADPGYQFRMQEGTKALERSAAARGGISSGRTLKDLTRFSQGLASEEYNNAYNRFNADRDRRFNRLASLAGIGQTATSNTQQASQNYGNQVSQNQIGLGNSVAAHQISQSNRYSQLLGQGLTAYALHASDRRLKTDVRPISRKEITELRNAIKPYMFRYIDAAYGSGDWIGVMAQDLEKSKLGKTVVVEDENGFKQIDMKKLASLLLAVLAEGGD